MRGYQDMLDVSEVGNQLVKIKSCSGKGLLASTLEVQPADYTISSLRAMDGLVRNLTLIFVAPFTDFSKELAISTQGCRAASVEAQAVVLTRKPDVFGDCGKYVRLLWSDVWVDGGTMIALLWEIVVSGIASSSLGLEKVSGNVISLDVDMISEMLDRTKSPHDRRRMR